MNTAQKEATITFSESPKFNPDARPFYPPTNNISPPASISTDESSSLSSQNSGKFHILSKDANCILFRLMRLLNPSFWTYCIFFQMIIYHQIWKTIKELLQSTMERQLDFKQKPKRHQTMIVTLKKKEKTKKKLTGNWSIWRDRNLPYLSCTRNI